MTIKDFIGSKVWYDDHGQMIFGESKNGDQLIVDVRGWGAIQNAFKTPSGELDLDKAVKFQDDLGKFVTEAINEKLDRDAEH